MVGQFRHLFSSLDFVRRRRLFGFAQQEQSTFRRAFARREREREREKDGRAASFFFFPSGGLSLRVFRLGVGLVD